jgi:hypothetical protein
MTARVLKVSGPVRVVGNALDGIKCRGDFTVIVRHPVVIIQAEGAEEIEPDDDGKYDYACECPSFKSVIAEKGAQVVLQGSAMDTFGVKIHCRSRGMVNIEEGRIGEIEITCETGGVLLAKEMTAHRATVTAEGDETIVRNLHVLDYLKVDCNNGAEVSLVVTEGTAKRVARIHPTSVVRLAKKEDPLAPPTDAGRDRKRPREEELKEGQQIPSMPICGICSSRLVAVTMVPCGHAAMCLTCSDSHEKTPMANRCPMCKAVVEKRQRLFFS